MLLHNTKPERLLESIIVHRFSIKSKLCIVNFIVQGEVILLITSPNNFFNIWETTQPHKETLEHTISRWIKSQIKRVGTEVETFQSLSYCLLSATERREGI